MYDLAETEKPGDGIRLAYEARRAGYTTVVAAGGDGTMNEVVNGLMQAAEPGETAGRLGFIPIGSGNDLASMAGYGRSLEAAVRKIMQGRPRRIDVGWARIEGAGGTVERYFANNAGVGFEARVTLESRRLNLGGALLYGVAALRALASYTTPSAHIRWETAQGAYEKKVEQILLIAIGNSARTGGGFYLTPDAKLDDGLLDVGIAQAVSRWRIMVLLPKALWGGHVSDPAVTMTRARRCQITCNGGLPIHLDGEVVMEDARTIEIELEPQRLEILV